METNIKIGEKTYSVSSDDAYLEAMGKDFEPHMVQLFRALIGPNDIVADIGANIGLTALLFSSLAKKTYAFEPSPSTFRILTENLARNDIANVEAVNLGLGQAVENLTITFAKNNRSGGYVSEKIRPESGHITEEIRIDTLDHFFTGRSPIPTFLKIDVEGYEMNVVRGGAEFLKTYQPTVVMEMNHFCLDVLQRITIPDFLDFMRSAFPYLYAIDTDNQTIVDLYVPDQAYMVMHEHVVKHRFPNLVGGFDAQLRTKLERLAGVKSQAALTANRINSLVLRAAARLSNSIKRRSISKPVGKIELLETVSILSPDGLTELPVRITNESAESWHGDGDHPVYLSYHWKKADGSMYVYDGIRTPLQHDAVAPGSQLEQVMSILPPNEPGAYRLVLTLVQEGVCWFEDRGFQSLEVQVNVG